MQRRYFTQGLNVSGYYVDSIIFQNRTQGMNLVVYFEFEPEHIDIELLVACLYVSPK